MSSNTEVTELKNIMLGFISEQKQFNEEQKQFNEEQRQFNEGQKQFDKEQREFNKNIDRKVDKVQYFLEETIAENTKMFFEEQISIKNHVRELEDEVKDMKMDLMELSSQFKLLKNS